MSQNIRDFVTSETELLALGEPTHAEPAFGWTRNDLFAQLVESGFRSIALEIDRVAALTVNDYIQQGIGTLDSAMREGFSHDWGTFDTNRALVARMRDYNQSHSPTEQLSFHGFDGQTENTTAHSPRRYLEYARDYLNLDLDIATLVGDDERWSRTEAIMDSSMSPGATPEAERLRALAADMLIALYERAPGLIAATSLSEWRRAETHLTAGIGLLRYHSQSALRIEESARITRLVATRDGLMAHNLLDIRTIESRRGPTLVFAHNLHLRKKTASTMRMGDMDVEWFGAGAIAASLLGDRYTFIAGSLGRSDHINLQPPEPNTYESHLQTQFPTWGLTTPNMPPTTQPRTTPWHGYFPLDAETVNAADAILHINTGTTTLTPSH